MTELLDTDEIIRRAQRPAPAKPRKGVRWKTFAEIAEQKTWPQPPVPGSVARDLGIIK